MPDSDLLSRELTDEPQALSADELARITGDLDVIEAMASAIATPEHGQVGFINMRRLLATIAADKARIAELQAEATRQAGVYERYLQEMVALYDAKLERARTWVDYHGDSAQWLADESDDLGDAHEAMTDEYDAEIAAVKVASDE